MKPLNESIVVVTGASGGIGKACVEAFIAAGSRVVMADVDARGEAIAASLGKNRCQFIAVDVTSPCSVERLIEETVSQFGSLDVLVNNAALIVPLAPVHETSVNDFENMMAVNVRGPFLCCKYAYPHLRSSRGCIVNVSSMSGVHGEKEHAVYSATKGALNALTMAMAIDYGPDGIRCNAVCPSSVLTPATDALIEALPNPNEVVRYRNSINHLGFTATPDQIASVIAFLASPAAAFMTGAVVPVSGGTECGYGVKS